MTRVSDIGTPGRCVVMGVINATPDSFSDGGQFVSLDRAVPWARGLISDGAAIVDVGGESTRPGAHRISAADEAARALPIVAALTDSEVPTSIDTTRSEIARAAVQAGACMVNDVSGGLADPAMLSTVAELEVPVVLMHWRAPSQAMDSFASYTDVVAEVVHHLVGRRDAALAAGISRDRIVLDPGLGFAKNSAHNWELLNHLGELTAIGLPLLVGASRKRFIGSALAAADGEPRGVDQRDAGTHAVSALAAAAGVWGVRVHEVAGTTDAVRIAQAWSKGGSE